MEAIASRLEAIRLEAIALMFEAIASRLEAIALMLEAIASRLEAIRLEAIALGLEAIATRLEAIALSWRPSLLGWRLATNSNHFLGRPSGYSSFLPPGRTRARKGPSRFLC